MPGARRSGSPGRPATVARWARFCRNWARREADPDLFGGFPTWVAAGVVNDTDARTQHEVDVAVFGRVEQGREELLAIGEATWHEIVVVGFADDVRFVAAADPGVQLVELDRSYAANRLWAAARPRYPHKTRRYES
ncbi:hypothetical protein ACN27G_16630 [Plantactinospora sp. WMMB334]|uniref:hypothetical protein n=1 Tax=Plantactinospora sp. WMMB334 TaxID=3404119 RepID=UPI003B943DC1